MNHEINWNESRESRDKLQWQVLRKNQQHWSNWDLYCAYVFIFLTAFDFSLSSARWSDDVWTWWSCTCWDFSPEVSGSSQSEGSLSGDSEQFHSNTSDDCADNSVRSKQVLPPADSQSLNDSERLPPSACCLMPFIDTLAASDRRPESQEAQIIF